MTWVSGAAITAAQLNAHLRDNMLETAVAKATTSSGYFVATGVNTIAQRTVSSTNVDTTETTTSSSYADLATIGPTGTVTSGARVLCCFSAQLINNTAGASCHVGIDISGATTSGATDSIALRHTSAVANAVMACSYAHIFGVTAGSNTFKLKYHVSTGTGSFDSRRLSLMPL
jgi:hypothetical protein